jgi:hypothetical protein
LAAEAKPRSATHTIFDRVQSRISSLTWRISVESAVLPGQHHTRTGIGVPGDGHTDHDLRQIVAGVLRLPPGLKPRHGHAVAVAVAVAVVLGRRVAPSVACHGGVGVLQLEVGAGGVEEQQIDLEGGRLAAESKT